VCPEPLLCEPSEPFHLRVTIGERVDPAAADALWRIVLGGVESVTGGGPSAGGAGTPLAGRYPEHTEGIGEAGPDVSA